MGSGAAGGSFFSSASAWQGKVMCVRVRPSLLLPFSFLFLLAGRRTADHQVQRLPVIAHLSPCMAYSLSLVILHVQLRRISLPMRSLGAASCVCVCVCCTHHSRIMTPGKAGTINGGMKQTNKK